MQQRVVGALVEKELTTPDNYPLSMNALLAACNQSTNRDPVMQLDERVVSNTLENLKSEGIVRVVYSKGMRVDKYRHVLPEAIGVAKPELALLTVMLLRGPQTGAELRARTERMHTFDGQADIDATLDALSRREPPLVRLQPRQPGQKEPRWSHLLGPAPEPSPAPSGLRPDTAPPPTYDPAPPPPPPPDRLADLEARVAALESRFDQLGLD